jgi:predicted O-methyltransferase YrrM
MTDPETVTGETLMDERKQRITAVLDTIPDEQYVDGYVDPKGKTGFRNPVRAGVAKGLTTIVDRLGIKQGVELGTALGRSGLYFALGGLERLDTVEFDVDAARAAQANFARADLQGFRVHHQDSGDFTRNYPDAIEMVFIDHAKERYLEDFQNLEGHLEPDALVLMDNTFNRAGECKDAVAYVADNYYTAIFTEPPTGGETTGLLVASKDRFTFDLAFQALVDSRAA